MGGRMALGDAGLQALCENGFDKALYLYPERYSGPRTVSCTGPDGKPNSLRYELANYFSNSDKRAILADIRARIQDSSRGPLVVHCWNGFHASGEIAAVALMQFCGYGASKAEAYWMRNQKGAKLISRIAKFSEIPDLRITSELESAICPR
jgi:hypothetical protein